MSAAIVCNTRRFWGSPLCTGLVPVELCIVAPLCTHWLDQTESLEFVGHCSVLHNCHRTRIAQYSSLSGRDVRTQRSECARLRHSPTRGHKWGRSAKVVNKDCVAQRGRATGQFWLQQGSENMTSGWFGVNRISGY